MHLRRECAARICVDGSECSRPQVACSGNGAAPLAPQHVPAHRESQQLRPCSSWVPYGSHSGAAATGAVAPASVAVNAADLQRHWLHCTCQPIVSRISCDLALAGCRMAVTAAQRRSAQLHLRRWQSQRRQSLLRFAQAQSKSALALFKRLASKPEPSQCPEQRRSCTCVDGSECSGLAAPLAPQHVPAHRESNHTAATLL